MEALDVGTEVAFYGLGEPGGLALVRVGDGLSLAEIAGKHRGGKQGVVIEGGSGEIGIPGRETSLQFVTVGTDDTLRIQLPAAVFQAPADQWPEFFGLGPVTPRKGIA